MKYVKLLSLLLVLCLLFAAMPLCVSAATSGSCGKNLTWSYNEATKTLSIYGTGPMDNYVFLSGGSGMHPWNYKVERVIISGGVTSIGDYAFSELTALKTVTIPGTVTSIGAGAFVECESLVSITIPGSVTQLGRDAFRRCPKLKYVTLSNGLQTIGSGAFESCGSITNISIPETVTQIGRGAFRFCSGLTKITIPKGVTDIPSDIFEYCVALRAVTLHDGILSIGGGSFSDCTALREFTVPNGTTNIYGNAFSGCTNLKKIQLPNTVEDIDMSAFSGCTSLTEITIPESVVHLGYDVFENCTSLKKILFQGDAPKIDSDAFKNVSATVSYPSGNNTWTDSVRGNYGGNLVWTGYTIKLGDVTGLKAAGHKTGIIVSWEKVPQAKLYQIYRMRSGESGWTLIRNTGSLSYKDTDTEVGARYYYKVVARNGDSRSSMNISSVSAVRPYPLDNANISKGVAHKTGNILYWESVEGADLYQLFRRVDGQTTWTLVTNTRSLAYKDTSASMGTTYHYKVRARNGDQMSSMSGASVALTRPYPLDNVQMDRAIGHATGNIIYWNAVENANLYQVYRRASTESDWTLIKNTGSLGYKDTTAESGVKYYYKVVARNGSLRSGMNIPAVSATRP